MVWSRFAVVGALLGLLGAFPASDVSAYYYKANVYKDFFKEREKTPCLARKYPSSYLSSNPRQKVHGIMLKEVSGGAAADKDGKYSFELKVAIKTAKLPSWTWAIGYCQSLGRNATCHLYRDKGSFKLTIQNRSGMIFKTEGLVFDGVNEGEEEIIGGDVSHEVLLVKRAGSSTCSEIDSALE